MAYHTYNTEVLVCGSKNHNTSDRTYLLFAREIGMVWATAKSVREERSRQRYALQEFSHAHLSLVRGKGGWKIGSVVPIANYYTQAHNREERALLRNLFVLMRRVLQGEEPQTRVFDEVVTVLTHQEIDPAHRELVCTLRVLEQLGYVGEEQALVPLLRERSVIDAISCFEEKMTGVTRQHITDALTSSHL